MNEFTGYRGMRCKARRVSQREKEHQDTQPSYCDNSDPRGGGGICLGKAEELDKGIISVQ